MSVITKILKQTCVYWPPSDSADFDDYGQPVAGQPVELNCRWSDEAEEIINPDGTALTSNTKVMVSSDVKPGGVLMLGTLEDVEDLITPKNNIGAYEILSFRKVPNFRCTEFMRIARL